MGWNIGTCSARKRLRSGRRWCGFCGGPRGCSRTHLALGGLAKGNPGQPRHPHRSQSRALHYG